MKFNISGFTHIGTSRKSNQDRNFIGNDEFTVINAGDSQTWVFRNDSMIKLTENQVLDPLEENSPITSYFGRGEDQLQLDFETVLREIVIVDVFLLCSDGLFKSLNIKQVKAILSNSKQIWEKVEFILKEALEVSAENNISCILIDAADHSLEGV